MRPALLLALVTACGEPTPWTPDEATRLLRLSPVPAPLPDPSNALADHPDAAELGRALFFDPRLSADGTVACVTCHDPGRDFTDGRARSEGIGTTRRNAPSVLTVAWSRWFFWDGRADTAWSQALGPLEDPAEHGTSRLAVVRTVAADPDLAARFEALLGPLPTVPDAPEHARPVPDDPSHPHHEAWEALDPDLRAGVDAAFAGVGKVLAAYQRALTPGWSPFDTFVEGLREDDPVKRDALSPSAQRGAALFVRHDCDLCHNGPLLTNGEFHNVGAPEPGEADRGRFDGIVRVQADPFNAAGAFSDDPSAGERLRFLVMGSEQLGQFKTPSLRNVARTAPYMSAGQLVTLEDVVRFYDTLGPEPTWGHREELLVPLGLSQDDVADLVAFLESLTGPGPEASLLAPPRW